MPTSSNANAGVDIAAHSATRRINRFRTGAAEQIVGAGYLRIAQPLEGSPGPKNEWFAEACYTLRLTGFVTLQPDVQAFRHPGGDGSDALMAGIRVKLRL